MTKEYTARAVLLILNPLMNGFRMRRQILYRRALARISLPSVSYQRKNVVLGFSGRKELVRLVIFAVATGPFGSVI